MELSIHDVTVKKFISLLPAMSKSTEWERTGKYYMSGEINIKELSINLFSAEYDKVLGIADEFTRAKDVGDKAKI